MLRIGAFAKRAAVSIKTLRFYDRLGVFRPMLVDPKSRYRYYGIQQLETVRELRGLRVLGMSVGELRQWVAAADDAHLRIALLTALRTRLRSRIRDDRQRLTHIDRYIDSMLPQTSSGYLAPTLRALPAMPALTLRDRVGSVGPNVYRMFESVERMAARHAARALKRPFLLFHDGRYRQRNADVEVCVPVVPDALSAVGGRIVESVAQAACVAFSGGYERGSAVAAVLDDWLRLSGARSAGPLREYYVRFGADQRGYSLPRRFLARQAADYRTELQLPILLPS